LYIVLEKSGKPVDIHALYKALEAFEIQEFVRSGKLAIHKGMKDLSDYLPEDFIMKKKTA
jgi:acetolactate synthase small subunit